MRRYTISMESAQVNGYYSFYADREYNQSTEQFGSYIWYERAVNRLDIAVQPEQGEDYAVVYVAGVKYYTDTDGKVSVDLSDYVRMRMENGVTSDSISIWAGQYQESLRVVYKRGVPPEDCILPQPDFFVRQSLMVVQTPPSVIVGGNITREGGSIILPVYIGVGPESNPNIVLTVVSSNGQEVQTSYNGYLVELPIQSASPSATAQQIVVDCRLGVETLEKSVHMLETPGDCDIVCLMTWRAENGAMKSAGWYLAKVSKSGEDIVEINRQSYLSRALKDEGVELTIELRGLGVYDRAWYGDIVTSSEVHCRVINTSTRFDSPDDLVEIVDSKMSYTLGDATAQSLQVTFKYKRYESGY